jgi:hypothetical protein
MAPKGTRILCCPDFVMMELVSYVNNQFEHQILPEFYLPVQNVSQFVSYLGISSFS